MVETRCCITQKHTFYLEASMEAAATDWKTLKTLKKKAGSEPEDLFDKILRAELRFFFCTPSANHTNYQAKKPHTELLHFLLKVFSLGSWILFNLRAKNDSLRLPGFITSHLAINPETHWQKWGDTFHSGIPNTRNNTASLGALKTGVIYNSGKPEYCWSEPSNPAVETKALR